MSYEATVFNVLIVSPGDVQPERSVVRDVIHEWNAVHATSRKLVFQPVAWETHSHPSMEDRAQAVLNDQILKDADLLVGIFWTRIGTPTGEAASGSIEEIERHLGDGKPAMIYFSSAPVRPDSVNAEQYDAVKKFKEECKARGLIDTYDSLEEFRQKFSRQLSLRINTDAYLLERYQPSDATLATLPDRRIPELSKEAKELLIEASKDQHGNIIRRRHIGGVDLGTNRRQFVDRGDPRSRAAWEGALDDLKRLHLIESVGRTGDVFQVTREGYEMAELLQG